MNKVNSSAASGSENSKNTGNPENWPALLQEATREVFDLMLQSDIRPALDGTVVGDANFTAMVGLAGKLRGVCLLQCSLAAADLIASKMLRVDLLETGDAKWDAVGEVCNMVAGNFKNKLAGIGEHCMLSCPTVIAGNDYKYRSLTGGQKTTVTMFFEGNPLGIVLEIQP